jgi:LuxR family maltose regulon positive regulatory protein
MDEARAIHDRLIQNSDQTTLSADLWTEIQMIGDVIREYENLPVTLEDLLSRETLLRTLPASDHVMLGHFTESLAAKYYDCGRLERAIEPTLAAREHYLARGSVYSDVFTRFHEARIRHAQGRLKDTGDVLAAARIQIENAFGDRSDLSANCAAFEAELLYDQDRLPEAVAQLEWSVPHMEKSDGWVDVYAAAYLTAARAAAIDGSLDEARTILARARRLARRRKLRQLELLAQLCELQLLLAHGQMDGLAQNFAREIGLDALAEEMERESPAYRHVAIAASLCRARLQLIEGQTEAALAELDRLRRWASEHGAGRLMIDVNILIAAGLHRMRQIAQAQTLFDEAVGMAMFQGIVRPFVDARRFVEPLLRTTLQNRATVDRFRDQFLKRLSRSFSSRPVNNNTQGSLSPAEVEVLTYLCRGYANKEIARLIDMSPDTVKYRLKSLYKKMGVGRRRDAVAMARDRLMAAE